MPKATTEPVTWTLTDHVCRVCFGRLLSRVDSDGVQQVRCANCGAAVTGKVSGLCCCGITMSKGRRAGFRCQRVPVQTPEKPMELEVVFEGAGV